jgi:hypothetical protein
MRSPQLASHGSTRAFAQRVHPEKDLTNSRQCLMRGLSQFIGEIFSKFSVGEQGNTQMAGTGDSNLLEPCPKRTFPEDIQHAQGAAHTEKLVELIFPGDFHNRVQLRRIGVAQPVRLAMRPVDTEYLADMTHGDGAVEEDQGGIDAAVSPMALRVQAPYSLQVDLNLAAHLRGGNDGVAVNALFDSRTANQLNEVLAFSIRPKGCDQADLRQPPLPRRPDGVGHILQRYVFQMITIHAHPKMGQAFKETQHGIRPDGIGGPIGIGKHPRPASRRRSDLNTVAQEVEAGERFAAGENDPIETSKNGASHTPANPLILAIRFLLFSGQAAMAATKGTSITYGN